jgi:hypothetical protein
MAVAIAHHHDRTKAKAPTTLDHFCHAVDLNDALLKFEALRIYSLLCHRITILKIQACLARRICQRLHAPVILKPAAVEDNLRNPGL